MARNAYAFAAFIAAVVAFHATAAVVPSHPRRVVLVTIDGMRADYLTDADRFHLRIPALRRLMARGAFSPRTLSVFPTLTVTAHTTLVTGATPRRHGILGNNKFDPASWVFRHNRDNYDTQAPYLDYANIRTPTLFDAVRAAGLPTGAVDWPQTERGPIDYRREIPARGLDPAVVDARAVRAATEILAIGPSLLAVHLMLADEAQHAAGPLTAEAFDAMEQSDANVGAIVDAVGRTDRANETTVIVTGDHGFLPMHTALAINLPLVEAGLISRGARDHPVWTAAIAANRGLGSLYLKPPDAAVLAAARRALEACRDRHPGTFRIVERSELDAFGADGDAALGVEPLPGYVLDARLDPPFARPHSQPGGHGYRPDVPGMETALIAAGPAIEPGLVLPTTRLVDVAPTIAALLGVDLAGADGSPIPELLRTRSTRR